MFPRILVAILLAGQAGCCLLAVVPPGREEMSTGVAVGAPSAARSSMPENVEQRLAAGVHAASLSRRGAFPVDVGAGYLFTRAGLDHARDIHGGYFEVAPSFALPNDLRVFTGARLEALAPDSSSASWGYGLLGRVSLETYKPIRWEASGSGHKSSYATAGYGMFGVGAFAELGAQQLPGDDRRAMIAVLGVALRNPAAIFVGAASK